MPNILIIWRVCEHMLIVSASRLPQRPTADQSSMMKMKKLEKKTDNTKGHEWDEEHKPKPSKLDISVDEKREP